MFLLHARLSVATFHFSLLSFMPCLCKVNHAMFNLAYREIPLPPTNLLLGAAKMGKTPKPLLVARLPTRCDQTFSSFLYASRRYNLQNSFICFRGCMGLWVGRVHRVGHEYILWPSSPGCGWAVMWLCMAFDAYLVLFKCEIDRKSKGGAAQIFQNISLNTSNSMLIKP